MHHNFLFDLDQTLLDFHASEYIGLRTVVNDNGYEFNDELYGVFKKRNKELWLDLEKGIISREELFKMRFGYLFDLCGADTGKLDLLKINDDFIRAMAQNGVVMKGAMEMLAKLKENIPDARIYIVSNGVAFNANGRINSTGMDRFLDDVFVSETIGAIKPYTEFFDHVIGKIGEPESSCIVIGDSLTSDMLGAQNAGIDSCWFMPEGDIDAAVKKYNIRYTASDFEELYDVLKNWASTV
ncbi:YjjG family noncanonical pyrimidine nucleotidase [Butyrivibrio sp. AE2032]|uniref:YjjG family noncanonical pyrimidine nucleotidase n=1 Tax=Butyrivibrio sp. AE2032 TaxID=1458463 RepID=UPI00055142C2|nr:YjjG family noncanonical pyrimidine nucleotidase [Butyrivibrio sp. AE2032]